jgi:hypothetical protein
MAQLTIYVPDDLADEVRQRKVALNVSQVCAQALRSELARLKQLEFGPPVQVDADALVERLRTQRQGSVARSTEAGRRAAERWVASAPYDSIQYYGKLFRFPPDHEALRDTYLDTLEAEGLRKEPLAYDEAWHAYVNQVWREVRDQL